MTDRDRAMARAQKRARQLRDFYGNLVTYLVVSALLVVIDLAGGSGESTFIGLDWAFWPILGWGFFVLIHAISVMMPMADWEERKTQELYEKELQRH